MNKNEFKRTLRKYMPPSESEAITAALMVDTLVEFLSDKGTINKQEFTADLEKTMQQFIDTIQQQDFPRNRI